MTPRAFLLDFEPLGCGYQTLWPLLKRFDLKNTLTDFEERVLKSSPTQHPLQALGSGFQPDIMRNHVNQFTVGDFSR